MECESIPLQDASQKGCELRADEAVSYQVNNLWDYELSWLDLN